MTSNLSHRIDLVQFRGPFTIEDVQVVGASPADRLRLGHVYVPIFLELWQGTRNLLVREALKDLTN